jgi:hypothetical protein
VRLDLPKMPQVQELVLEVLVAVVWKLREKATNLGTFKRDDVVRVGELIPNLTHYCQAFVRGTVEKTKSVGHCDLGGQGTERPIASEEFIFKPTA